MPEQQPSARRNSGSTYPRPAVLVVGGGPTGLTAANLLGSMGVSVLLVERNDATSNDAKAISLDDESMRIVQLAGLDEVVYPIIVPGTGTRYFGARGQVLAHARGVGNYRFGHPFKNPFAQPDLELVLREALSRYPHVQERFGTQLVGIRQYRDHVRVSLQATGGEIQETEVGYVLGCDGGRSTVRELLSIPMTGRSFTDVWLVVDTLEDPHDQRYGLHYGDPDRPHVIVPGRDGRCRYEFLLKPGEGRAGAPPRFELVRDLVRPYRSLTPDQVERAVAYTFNAVLADRLREGRCFLLGDAAHMMPPFAGQGLNSGIRDAANLCWKVAERLAGRAADALLDTYDTERRPNARATIRLSVRLGQVVMTTSRRRARLRDLLVGAAVHSRPGRQYFSEMRYRPSAHLRAGAVVRLGPGNYEDLAGRLLPQPRVLNGHGHQLTRLDDVLTAGWSILGISVTDADWAAVDHACLPDGTRVDVALEDRAPRERQGRAAIADADGQLDAVFGDVTGHFVLVRPDRVVAAVFAATRAAEVAASLRRYLSVPAVPTAAPAGTEPTPAREGHTPLTEQADQGARG